jgi:broad specificity polyphosphatase/5'/3'-nucleotidase SurE
MPVTFEEHNGQADRQRYKYAGAYKDRPVDPDSDVEHVFGGGISVTPLGLNTVAPDIPAIDFSDG